MPAMATVTKFTFDLDFDAPEDAAQSEPEIEEPEVEEEQVPTFSEEEVEEARSQGFEAGKEEGRKESADATEQRLLETVEAVCAELAKIYESQTEANQDIAKEMIQISTAIAKKMFPDLNARNALGEVERVVQDTLKAITDEPRAQIMVHPDLREPLTERLGSMTQRAGFEGKIFVNPDTSVPLGDCRVEWSHGAAVRDSEAILEQIDEIIDRNLHGEDAVVIDQEPTEDKEPSHQDEDEQSAPKATSTEADATSQLTEDDRTVAEPDNDEQMSGEQTEIDESDDLDAEPELTAPPQDRDLPESGDVTGEDFSEDTARSDDHFAPSETAVDTPAPAPDPEETFENQGVAEELGEPPIPHVDGEMPQPPEDTEDSQDVSDTPPPMTNADPVSPDMTAAILDAQGALSEEEDK